MCLVWMKSEVQISMATRFDRFHPLSLSKSHSLAQSIYPPGHQLAVICIPFTQHTYTTINNNKPEARLKLRLERQIDAALAAAGCGGGQLRSLRKNESSCCNYYGRL